MSLWSTRSQRRERAPDERLELSRARTEQVVDTIGVNSALGAGDGCAQVPRAALTVLAGVVVLSQDARP
jgi:hypothetical protein